MSKELKRQLLVREIRVVEEIVVAIIHVQELGSKRAISKVIVEVQLFSHLDDLDVNLLTRLFLIDNFVGTNISFLSNHVRVEHICCRGTNVYRISVFYW